MRTRSFFRGLDKMGGFFEELSDRRVVSISLFMFLAVALAHKTVDARFTGNMVEVFHENVRVPRIKKSRSTQAYDAPSAHALGASGDDELFGWQDKSLGQSIGPSALTVVNAMIEARPLAR